MLKAAAAVVRKSCPRAARALKLWTYGKESLAIKIPDLLGQEKSGSRLVALAMAAQQDQLGMSLPTAQLHNQSQHGIPCAHPQPSDKQNPQMDQKWTPQQQHFMQLALEQARVAQRVREVPIGCVVVRGQTVIGTGYNMTNHTRNATRHAELEAIDRILAEHGGDVVKADFGSCELYVTIEPCIMCAGALSLLGFQRVYYGAGNDKFGGCGSILSIHQSTCGCCDGSGEGAVHGKPFQVEGGLFADEAIQLLQQFYIAGNPQAPKPKRIVLDVPPWEQGDAQEQQQQAKQETVTHDSSAAHGAVGEARCKSSS